MSVTQIDDYRPHLTIRGSDGNIHVLPVQLALDVVAGRRAPSALGDACLQTIVKEWLLTLGVRPPNPALDRVVEASEDAGLYDL